MAKNYNKHNKRNYHKNQREGGRYLASLTDEEFDSILKLPVGFPRVYLCAMRRSFKSPIKKQDQERN